MNNDTVAMLVCLCVMLVAGAAFHRTGAMRYFHAVVLAGTLISALTVRDVTADV